MTDFALAEHTGRDWRLVPVDLGSLWRSLIDDLADDLPSPQLRGYLPLIELVAIVGDTALLAVPDRR